MRFSKKESDTQEKLDISVVKSSADTDEDECSEMSTHRLHAT